jgi:hypothetical protein
MSLMLLVFAVFISDQEAITSQRSTNAPPPAADRSVLRIVAVEVSPAGRKAPGTEPPPASPDALYQLRVRIRNNGSESASDLTFQVTVNGQRLAPYVNHTFRSDLSPGKETDVPLYNFWSSESGRPFPADGRLVVEVRLTGARWMSAGDKTPSDVQPLPAPFAVTLVSRKTS